MYNLYKISKLSHYFHKFSCTGTYIVRESAPPPLPLSISIENRHHQLLHFIMCSWLDSINVSYHKYIVFFTEYSSTILFNFSSALGLSWNRVKQKSRFLTIFYIALSDLTKKRNVKPDQLTVYKSIETEGCLYNRYASLMISQVSGVVSYQFNIQGTSFCVKGHHDLDFGWGSFIWEMGCIMIIMSLTGMIPCKFKKIFAKPQQTLLLTRIRSFIGVEFSNGWNIFIDAESRYIESV